MASPARTKWLIIAGVAFALSALALSAWSISLAGEHERARYGSQGHTSGGLAPQARTSPDPDGWWGNPLPEALAKADFRLTDQHGRPFSFLEATDGKTTLLFFGFTNCPDVCPGTMAMIAAAERHLPAPIAEDLEVVFVTTDPARDTPDRLEEWIGLFDPGFTALTGTPAALAEAQTLYDVPPAEQEQLGDGVYAMRHLDQVLAFGPDGLARYAYAPGTPPEGLAADLERLANAA
jgi:protein SCO1/2